MIVVFYMVIMVWIFGYLFEIVIGNLVIFVNFDIFGLFINFEVIFVYMVVVVGVVYFIL